MRAQALHSKAQNKDPQEQKGEYTRIEKTNLKTKTLKDYGLVGGEHQLILVTINNKADDAQQKSEAAAKEWALTTSSSHQKEEKIHKLTVNTQLELDKRAVTEGEIELACANRVGVEDGDDVLFEQTNSRTVTSGGGAGFNLSLNNDIFIGAGGGNHQEQQQKKESVTQASACDYAKPTDWNTHSKLPPWRHVGPGLHFNADCLNVMCPSKRPWKEDQQCYQALVMLPIGQAFEFKNGSITEPQVLECQACHEKNNNIELDLLEPRFVQCEYRKIGILAKDNKIDNSDWQVCPKEGFISWITAKKDKAGFQIGPDDPKKSPYWTFWRLETRAYSKK